MIQFDGNNFKFLLQKSVPEDIAANLYSGREESIFSHIKKLSMKFSSYLRYTPFYIVLIAYSDFHTILKFIQLNRRVS